MTEPTLSFATRLWFAFACFWRVLLDERFARRVYLERDALPSPPAPSEPPAPAAPAPVAAPEASAPRIEVPASAPTAPIDEPGPEEGALQVLAMLQREGRLLDFLEEDTVGISDLDLGAASRQIHRDCRAALRSLLTLEPVRAEEEGQPLTILDDYDAGSLKLTGSLRGIGPYRGVLKHRGWRASEVRLPRLLPGADARVLAPAEVEVG